MPNRPTTSPAPPEVTLTETARSALADLADLANRLPGDTARNAQIAGRLSEELAETGEMLRAACPPGRDAWPRLPDAGAAAVAVAAGEDAGETIARALARLAADLGGQRRGDQGPARRLGGRACGGPAVRHGRPR